MDPKELKEQVLASCNAIPLPNLINYVRKGVVPLDEFRPVLNPAKFEQMVASLSEYEAEDWEKARIENTVASYQTYLTCNPNGPHAEEARRKLDELEESYWSMVSNAPTKEGLDGYLKSFPNGRHCEACNALLDDLPYLEALKIGTIKAFRDYMDKYPGKHTEEILQRIENIEDEKDWATACANNSKEAFRVYLQKHPNGKFADEAESRIAYRSGKDLFIEALQDDPNCFSAKQIQDKVDNGTATWNDLLKVFNRSKVEAIKSWTKATELPKVPDLEKLPKGFTEVFFWGTKGTGKTCVIGSVLGSLVNIKRNYIPIQSDSEQHRIRLTNLFSDKDNIITLPDSTDTTNLPAMTFRIRDEKLRQHQIMLIDMAGEAFTGIYKKRNKIGMTKEEEYAVKKIDTYLKGKQRNPTLHFFVVEYDGANNDVDPIMLPGIKQINVLTNVAAYFQEEGIFRNSTVGVYVVVTKCDKIKAPREERAKIASDYLSTGQMGLFVDLLQNEYAKKARVSDFRKISFSIGDVFAKNFCVFDNTDTDKIVNKLLMKTHWVTGEKLWEKILGWLRYH